MTLLLVTLFLALFGPALLLVLAALAAASEPEPPGRVFLSLLGRGQDCPD